jgi:hypothetical protein
MSLLTMVQGAADQAGITRPSMAYGGSDATTRRMLALANTEGQSLARLSWPILRKEATFTALAQEVQTGAVPADWGRFVDRTFWNRTSTRRLIGPYTPDQWQDLKAHTGSGVTDGFTYRGADILITPTPTAGHTMAYEYFSKNWCKSADGTTPRAAWGADTDVGILPEELMMLGIVWRFKKASSMEWAGDYAVYDSEVRTALGQSAPAGRIDFSGAMPTVRTFGIYVPERNWVG